jgi:hypothetical protein
MFKRILTLLLLCLLPGNTWAKCALSTIVIDGSISGPSDGSTVSVQVLPDPNWNSEPAPVVDTDGKFHVTRYFDPYDGPGWVVADRCSREPKTITIQLHRNGQLLDQVVLEISRDFVTERNIDFRLRSPITLRSNSAR